MLINLLMSVQKLYEGWVVQEVVWSINSMLVFIIFCFHLLFVLQFLRYSNVAQTTYISAYAICGFCVT